MNALPAGPFYPTNVLVTVAWLSQRVPEFVGKNMVGPSLPARDEDWVNGGFITASDDRGGISLVDIPVRRPLMRVDVWASTPSSNVPPLKLAAYYAECIRNATESTAALYDRPVTLPNNYLAARVQAAFVVGELRSVKDDPSGYARVTMDLEVDWVRP